MTNNHYNIDKKLREMENQLAPDLTLLENHWQHMNSILVSPSPVKLPGKGFLKNPFRLFTLLCIAGLTCFLIYKYAPSASIQPNSNISTPSTTPIITEQTDTVPRSKKKVAAPQRTDSLTPAKPRKKTTTNKKTNPANKAHDSISIANSPDPKNLPNDTAHFYSTNKKVATHVSKKPTTSQKVLYAKPVRKKYPTTDTVQLNQDSVSIKTNLNHNKKPTKKIGKSNNKPTDSTTY